MSIKDDQLIYAMLNPKAKIDAIERLARSLGITIPPPDWKNRRRAMVQAIERELHLRRLNRSAFSGSTPP